MVWRRNMLKLNLFFAGLALIMLTGRAVET